MKKSLVYLTLFIVLFGCKNGNRTPVSLKDSSGEIRVHAGLDAAARPFYQVFFGEKMVLDTSRLGLTTATADFSENLKLIEISSPATVTDQYQMLHGKQRDITYEALQYVVKFENKDGLPFECHFNLSKNGVAFRYHLPQGDSIKILKEASSFGFAQETKGWMQPLSKAKSGWKETNPSYEEHYLAGVPVSTESPIGEGFVYPALFQTNDTWVLVSETNLHRDYCGTHLKYDNEIRQLRVTMPQAAEVMPGGELLSNGKAPFTTPWRILAIGSLQDVVESTLGTDLAAPAISMDTDFIQPGLASWSWVLLKDDFTNYETSHRFIDYAAEMNWPYCLIDADWDWKIGYERMQELVDYAKSKNVKILLWYNSSGDWNSTTYTPKSKLVKPEERKAEFARLEKMGVAGCKVDFFGGDGQSVIAYYHDILQDAAAHRLLLNFHGATLPRGWHRTYPHLMTVEAIKGEEFITFEQANADRQPEHCTIIPFTRNVFDPMDFTPMALDSIPNIIRRTTASFELALPVLFTSGVQHMAEIPEGMRKMPAYVVEYLKDIPVQWDETRFLAGFPGKDVILARRKGGTWHIAGINGESTPKTFDLDLSFVQNKTGVLFHDGEGKTPERKELDTAKFQVQVKPYGGFVVKI